MCPTFAWVLEIHFLVLMIMLQVFYQLSHLPNQHFKAIKIVTLLSGRGGGGGSYPCEGNRSLRELQYQLFGTAEMALRLMTLAGSFREGLDSQYPYSNTHPQTWIPLDLMPSLASTRTRHIHVAQTSINANIHTHKIKI